MMRVKGSPVASAAAVDADGMNQSPLFGEIVAIDIDQIDTSDRLRPVDPAHVAGIAASIALIGLKQPIIVRPQGNRYQLIAGAHRLAAVGTFNWGSIDAIVENLTDDEARLVEIDENLMRRELSALDRAIFLAERKTVYDALYPETVKSGRKSRESAKTFRQFGETFTKVTANRLGLNKRTIEIALSLAKNLTPKAREALRLSDVADNQSELIKLAALDPEKQVLVAREVAAGRAKSPKAARLALGIDVLVEQDPQEKLFEQFLALFARMEAPTRKRVVDHLAGAGKAKKAKASGEDA